MALCNDNFWGFATFVIARYKVRWIELAAILPVWTHMAVYYVEGDYGHTMKSPVAKEAFRTAVRGHCFSLIMPWEDIMKSLDGMMTDAELAVLPWGPECLKYLVRLQLRVAGKDLEKHLKEVKARPFILIKLLHELTDRHLQTALKRTIRFV